MQRDLEAYLWDISHSIEQIQLYVAGQSFDQYLANELVQSGVERKFEIIGEAMKQASQLFPGRLNSLPDLSNYAGFRDRLAHGYFNVRHQIVWDAIFIDLPLLQKAVALLLSKSPL
jgi:uncharacterized protein with HEPN domain